jgi:carbon monoxide dehydrogenase subunit G
MVKFQTTAVRVKRPPEEVFAYVADPNRHAELSSAVQESTLEGFGPVAKGSHYRQKLKFLGRTIEGLAEVSDDQPNRRVEFGSLSGPMPYTWDVVVEGSDGGAVIVSHSEAEPGGRARRPGAHSGPRVSRKGSDVWARAQHGDRPPLG